MTTSKIPGWSPNTDLLLRHVFPTFDEDCPPSSGKPSRHIAKGPAVHGSHGGFDIIDHAFGYKFPSALLKELQSHGWVDTPTNGGRGKLSPARTKMDVDLSNIFIASVNDFLGSDVSDNVDASRSNWGSSGVRGDESAFIPRKDRSDALEFSLRYPALHHLISSIEDTAIQRLGTKKEVRERYGEDHEKYSMKEKPSPAFVFDTSLTSVQVAKFPGDGRAGYPRHCDRGNSCLVDTARSDEGGKGMERILTFVYYLTPPDWDADSDGGALRLFSPIGEVSKSDTALLAKESNYDTCFDVIPYSDRMVVFRSDLIEHQVMPSFRRDRMAVTVWLYGRAISSRNEATKINFTDNSSNQTFEDAKVDRDEVFRSPPPLALPSNNFREKTVFVAIPSYRDKETWPTIKSLIQMARYPGRFYIGVVWQVDTKSQQEMDMFTSGKDIITTLKSSHWENTKNLRSIIVGYTQSTGPCYARYLAQTLHRGEDYVLQIDSHMRFRPNWDEYLIAQLHKCGSSSEKGKAVLTAYPPGYELPCGPGEDAETRGTILVPWKFGDDGILRQKGRLLRREYTHSDSFGQNHNDNIPCLLYAGGFNFFQSSLLDVCSYDRKLHGLFFGEEISMAVRLFTHGYDLFAPPESVCYHLWKRNPLRNIAIHRQNLAVEKEDAISVVREQVRGRGRGLGTIRVAEQFALQLGVNFETLTLSDGCENANLDSDAFVSSFRDNPAAISDCMDLSKENINQVMALVSQFTGH
mmetsp:Transcript_24137/g.50125  ORF Transcript_24137/g.50125 Transcript_24137/m.50125 type:complete len:749 (-) Transcript_24137:2633-4879(-)